MLVIMNPGRQRSTLDELGQALGIASQVFGVVMNTKQKSQANEIAKMKEARVAETSAETGKAAVAKFSGGTQETSNASAPGLILPGAFPKGAPELGEGSVGRVPISVVQNEKQAENRERANRTAMAKAEKAEKTAAAKEDFRQTDSLSDDYNKASKETVSSVSGYKRLEAAFNNPNPTGATDLAGIFGFMKSIDPGSTVREGEFANAENSQGVDNKIRSVYNRAIAGERLSPQARKDFLVEGRNSLLAQLETQKIIDDRFAKVSEKFGVNPNFVVNQQFQELRESLGDAVQRPQTGPVNIGSLAPGAVIDIGGVQMRVNPDGTATEIGPSNTAGR